MSISRQSKRKHPASSKGKPLSAMNLPHLPVTRSSVDKVKASSARVLYFGEQGTHTHPGKIYSLVRVSRTKPVETPVFMSIHGRFAETDAARTAKSGGVMRALPCYELLEPDENAGSADGPLGQEHPSASRPSAPRPDDLPSLRRELAPLCSTSPARAVVASFYKASECAQFLQENPAMAGFYRFRLVVTELLDDCNLYSISPDGTATPLFLHACFSSERPGPSRPSVALQSDSPALIAKNPPLEIDTVAFMDLETQRELPLRAAVAKVRAFYSRFDSRAIDLPESERQKAFEATRTR